MTGKRKQTSLGSAITTALAITLISSLPIAGAQPALQQRPATAESYVGNPEFGVNFITSAEAPADADRYARAQQTGAGWSRWPIYWYSVNPNSCQDFDWSRVDVAVAADINHGFSIDAILLQTAPCAQSGGRRDLPAPHVGQHLPTGGSAPASGGFSSVISVPQNLNLGVFDDGTPNGTDDPGDWTLPVKMDNYWAWFVFQAVDRYRPGGVFAQQQGWEPSQGVSVWEIWNEEDYSLFWAGTAADYARLLKVGYLAAKRADRASQVMFGGLANITPDSAGNYPFLGDTLAALEPDPLATTYGYFFDILAIHNYGYAWMTWFHTYADGQTLTRYSLSKPIWVNESGVPVWNEYPGPTWDPLSAFRATTDEQASFILESAALSKFAGASVIFHFQLQDDCGNDPAGTNFPDNVQEQQELCAQGQICAGDGFGLFHNGPTSPCYWSDPTPWAARPALTAYQVMSNTLSGVTPSTRQRPSILRSGDEELVRYYRPATGDWITFVWARYNQDLVAPIQALAPSATLLDQRNNQQTITPVSGVYTLTLPAATNYNTPTRFGEGAIGGQPWILIEHPVATPKLYVSLVMR